MKITATIAATSMALAGVAAAADHTSRELIVGGTVVKKGMFGAVCGIRSSATRKNFCAGALISCKHVITTAACGALHKELVPLYASCGSLSVRGQADGEQIKVVSVQNHPQYNEVTGEYDLAMLTLEKQSTITPFNFPISDDKVLEPGKEGVVVGWGATAYGKNYSEVLLSVTLKVSTPTECAKFGDSVTKANFCAGGVKGKDTCQGDQGAPFLSLNEAGEKDDFLIGLSSSYGSCGKFDGVPAVFERLSKSIVWIRSFIDGLKCV